MQKSFISDHEREIAKQYLATGIKPEGFRTLLYRIRQHPVNRQLLTEDIDLVEKVLEKAGQIKNK